MANERVPTQRGREVKDEIVILVGGKAFDGWEQVSVKKNLESIANGFSIKLFDKFEGLRQQWPLKPGVAVQVSINRQRVLTGRIEQVAVDYTDERRGYTISGRSKPGDLVDSMHIGSCEYTNIGLDKLAEELVKPFGLKVFLSVVPAMIDKFALKPGETVFEALDRAARAQGFFFISTREGNIRLTRAARERAKTDLEQGINILSATANYDDSQRHDQYIVKGQTIGLPNFNGDKVTSPEGTAKDLGVTRYRPFVMISEANADSAKAKTRAEWEASSRLAKAVRVNATVQGWTQSEGTIWGINQVLNFKSTFLGLNRDLLIVGVSHEDGATTGKTTALTLTDPQAYNPEPEKNKKKKDDIFAALGAEFAK
jgi:prophage tail gpP-like protein